MEYCLYDEHGFAKRMTTYPGHFPIPGKRLVGYTYVSLYICDLEQYLGICSKHLEKFKERVFEYLNRICTFTYEVCHDDVVARYRRKVVLVCYSVILKQLK